MLLLVLESGRSLAKYIVDAEMIDLDRAEAPAVRSHSSERLAADTDLLNSMVEIQSSVVALSDGRSVHRRSAELQIRAD